jgi:hypothetical protein
MTKREQLLQELENTSDDVLDSVLEFLRFINAHPAQSIDSAQRLDALETIIGIRKGLEEFDRGEGIPAAQALKELQHRLNIPSRP